MKRGTGARWPSLGSCVLQSGQLLAVIVFKLKFAELTPSLRTRERREAGAPRCSCAKALGAKGWLLKPFKPELLEATARVWVSKSA